MATVRQWDKVVEVTEILGVAPISVYRTIHARRLPATRFGRCYRVPVEALDELKQGATETVPTARSEPPDPEPPAA